MTDRLTAIACSLIRRDRGYMTEWAKLARDAATICAALDAEEKRADEKRFAEDRAAHGAKNWGAGRDASDPLTILPATKDVVMTNILRDPATEICYCGGEQVLCGTGWISPDAVLHSRAICYAMPDPPPPPPPAKPRDKRCRVAGCADPDGNRIKTSGGYFCAEHMTLPHEDRVRASEAYDKAKRAAKRATP